MNITDCQIACEIAKHYSPEAEIIQDKDTRTFSLSCDPKLFPEKMSSSDEQRMYRNGWYFNKWLYVWCHAA
jgi:hypothetical protein